MVRGQAERHVGLGVEVAERFAQGAVEHVARQAAERAVPLPQEHRVVEKPVQLDRRLGHEPIHFQTVGQGVAVAQICEAGLLGQRPQQQVFGDDAGPYQERAEPAAHGLLYLPGAVDVGLLRVVAFDEQLTQPILAKRRRQHGRRSFFRVHSDREYFQSNK